MKEFYTVEDVLINILSKDNEYFLPAALYAKNRKIDTSFLFQGRHITFEKWIELSKPKDIQIRMYNTIYNLHPQLWEIDIRSERFFLSSDKITQRGYSLLLFRCISPQCNLLLSRLKKLNPDTDLYKYSSLILHKFYEIFYEIKKFTEKNSVFSKLVVDIEGEELDTSKKSFTQKLSDTIRPIMNEAYSYKILKKNRIPIRGSKNENHIFQNESKEPNDGMYTFLGYSHKEWNLFTKQKRVEIFAGNARKDIDNSQNHWWKKFKAEFPKGYSTELLRYKKKFKKQNRQKPFKINGLTFYKGKE